MGRPLHELSDLKKEQTQDKLLIPAGEFVALLAAAVLMLGLVFGPATLGGTARNALFATVASFSRAINEFGSMGSQVEARTSQKDGTAGRTR